MMARQNRHISAEAGCVAAPAGPAAGHSGRGLCGGPPRQPAIPALAGQAPVQIPDVDLLRLTPEMRAFSERYAKRGADNTGKAWMLAYAALDPYLLDFDYDPMVTLPADEAFRLGRGNCLTFSSMFVAMARDAGLTAWYQEVIVPPEWSAVNETLLVSKHVNAVVAEWNSRYVIDVSRRKQNAAGRDPPDDRRGGAGPVLQQPGGRRPGRE